MDGRHAIIGIGLILFSVWLLLKLVISQILRSSIPYTVYQTLYRVLDALPSLLIPVLCIAIGIKLLSGNKKSTGTAPVVPSSGKEDEG